jgi:molybdopterin-guanine dinucleotide biosynthesis protein A
MPSMTIGLILAGGRSSRFGGIDKTFISLSGKSLLAHVIARLGPQVDMLAVSSNLPASRFEPLGLRVIPDVLEGVNGPLAGIYSGLIMWPESELITVAVDLPFLPCDLVRRLKQGRQGAACAFATDGVRHALAVWWAPNAAVELGRYVTSGGRSLKVWLDRHGQPVTFPPQAEADITFNVNTPEDLALAEDWMRQI